MLLRSSDKLNIVMKSSQIIAGDSCLLLYWLIILRSLFWPRFLEIWRSLVQNRSLFYLTRSKNISWYSTFTLGLLCSDWRVNISRIFSSKKFSWISDTNILTDFLSNLEMRIPYSTVNVFYTCLKTGLFCAVRSVRSCEPGVRPAGREGSLHGQGVRHARGHRHQRGRGRQGRTQLHQVQEDPHTYSCQWQVVFRGVRRLAAVRWPWVRFPGPASPKMGSSKVDEQTHRRLHRKFVDE